MPLGGVAGGGGDSLGEGVRAEKGRSSTTSWVEARSSYKTHMQQHFEGCKIRRKQRECKTLRKRGNWQETVLYSGCQKVVSWHRVNTNTARVDARLYFVQHLRKLNQTKFIVLLW